MQKFEMEKQKISYEISGESHVCFSEIGISTENQVSYITDKEGKREGKLPVEGRGFLPERGMPQGRARRGKTPDSKGKGTKKGLTGGAKRGKIISTLADTHINPCCY